MMSFLQMSLFENTVQDYIISLAIFVSSLFIAKYVYHILRQTVCEIIMKVQTTLTRPSINHVCALSTYLIPIGALLLAKNRLVFEYVPNVVLNNLILISGQIVFLLILTNIVTPLIKAAANKHLNSDKLNNYQQQQAHTHSLEKIDKHTKELAGMVLVLVPLLTVLSIIGLVPNIVWALPGIIVLIKLTQCWKVISSLRGKVKETGNVEAEGEAPAFTETLAGESESDVSLKQSILEFFLDIFKHQIGVSENSPAEFRRVDPHPFSTNQTYELRVKTDNDWTSRRMTIGRLGEDAGSRSKCFYAIYDDHIVVKIPPVQIKTFDEYIAILKKESRIVDQLSMEECIVPRVSVILKNIRSPSAGDFLAGGIEGNYIKLLKMSSKLQSYLKIGGSFAFFMDLSRYYFLQYIIDHLHDNQNKLYDETRRHLELLENPSNLSNSYEFNNMPLFMKLQKIYITYEKTIRKLITKSRLTSPISKNYIKKWFVVHLNRNKVFETEIKLPVDFVNELNKVGNRIISEGSDIITQFRELIKKSTYETTVTKNKAYMEGLVANLLDLLSHLRERGVAMRDLKPENLLVAGDRQKYPAFLAYPEEYKIGLIDVETAVIWGSFHNRRIGQPRLGGTPSYATPSHLFRNEVLNYVFEDLSTILHLQDWHATIAIIYKVVTGDFLFGRTAKLLPTIIEIIQKSTGDMKEICEMVEYVSKMFWSNAVIEFRAKLDEKERVLKSISVSIPENANQLLKEFTIRLKHNTTSQIEKSIATQHIFTSTKNRQFLLSCSVEKVAQLKKQWKNKVKDQSDLSMDGSQVINFLQKLETLKLQLTRYTRMLNSLGQLTPEVSAHQLLQIMFDIILKHMYRDEWKPLLSQSSGYAAGADGDISNQATMVAESA
ncbi:MAG: hypothetical protein JSU72_04610 [Deltaproteobacteria bacterium]|nr:MAG: hypothetical protein JSU72_04610 [Deltaproteobacteria bacterium]